MKGRDKGGAGAHVRACLLCPGIFLHVLADTLGSVGVIISSLLIHYYNIYIADAIASITISVLVVLSVIPLLRCALNARPLLATRTPVSIQRVVFRGLIEVWGHLFPFSVSLSLSVDLCLCLSICPRNISVYLSIYLPLYLTLSPSRV